jgi:hypothetical protein
MVKKKVNKMGFGKKLRKGLEKAAGGLVEDITGSEALGKGVKKGIKKGSVKKGIKEAVKEGKDEIKDKAKDAIYDA